MVAQPLVPAAPLVISNDNRRKNARQRAGGSDNLIWMQKVSLLARNHSVRLWKVRTWSILESVVTGNGQEIRNAKW